jgi:hypothetical protein
MSKTETRVVYYNKKQLNIIGENAAVKLYSDKDRKNVVGQALYKNLNYINSMTSEYWTQENATFFFGEDDCISFISNSKTIDGVLPAGTYNYSIICGQGKYFGATGSVNFKVTDGGLRIVTINAKLA